MVDISNTAQKWALLFVGVFVVATLAAVFFPMLTGTATSSGILSSTGALVNATGASYSTLITAVPTILIIVFVIALILMAIAALKTHR